MSPRASAAARAARPSPAPVRPRPSLRVVHARATRPSRRPFVLLVAGLLSVGLIALLLLNTLLAQGAFTVRDLQDRTRALDVREQALSQEVALAESPQQLAARARALGLVPAANPAFIRLSDGRLLGVAQPALAPVRPAPRPSAAAKPAPAKATTAKPQTSKTQTARTRTAKPAAPSPPAGKAAR